MGTVEAPTRTTGIECIGEEGWPGVLWLRGGQPLPEGPSPQNCRLGERGEIQAGGVCAGNRRRTRA